MITGHQSADNRQAGVGDVRRRDIDDERPMAGRHDPVDQQAEITSRVAGCKGRQACERHLETLALDHKGFTDRAAFDSALIDAIEPFSPELVVLAGFMRILTPTFVRRFAGRLINIHPALLPALPGLNTHERAIAAGLEEHGATVHFATEEVDKGPIIVQARVPVLPDDTPEELAKRVLTREHRILPQAIRWFATGRLRLHGGMACLDGEPISHPSPPAPMHP